MSQNCAHNLFYMQCKYCSPEFFGNRSISFIRSAGKDEPIGVEIDGRFIGYDPTQNDISTINAINGDDMKRHIPEIDPNILAEHQALHEWEERKALVAELRRQFLSLTVELKREVLKDVCMYCLQESREPCKCDDTP